MKKEFLDQLYAQRHKIISAIELMEERRNLPKSFCGKCKSNCDENQAKLDMARVGLASIDSLIVGYVKTHNS